MFCLLPTPMSLLSNIEIEFISKLIHTN